MQVVLGPTTLRVSAPDWVALPPLALAVGVNFNV